MKEKSNNNEKMESLQLKLNSIVFEWFTIKIPFYYVPEARKSFFNKIVKVHCENSLQNLYFVNWRLRLNMQMWIWK